MRLPFAILALAVVGIGWALTVLGPGGEEDIDRHGGEEVIEPASDTGGSACRDSDYAHLDRITAERQRLQQEYWDVQGSASQTGVNASLEAGPYLHELSQQMNALDREIRAIEADCG